MNSNTQTHVIFGTGPVGLAIMDALISQGQTPRMVNRRGIRPADMPASVELVSGDVSDPAFTRQAAQGASHIYNATNPEYTEWLQKFPPLQAAILAAAEAQGAKLISMENVYAYGDPEGRPMTEDMPHAAKTRKGKLRAGMMKELLAAHRAGRVRVVMGMASDFFGPRVLGSSLGDRFFYPLVAGKAAQYIGKPGLPHTYTYMPDIGQALVTLGQKDEALGRAWHMPSPKTISTQEVLAICGDILGRPLKISTMPKPLFKLLTLFVPVLREIDEMLYEFEKPHIVDHSQYAAAFGDHSTPMRTALEATLKWYQANPQPK
jgi:nucleoside-diphosphate-sugar epimerase